MKKLFVLFFLFWFVSCLTAAPQVGTLIRGETSSGSSVAISTDADGNIESIITGLDYVNGKSGIDPVTEGLQIVTHVEMSIHSGTFYRAGSQKNVANGGTFIFVITTPDTTTRCHFNPNVEVELEASVELWENPTSVTGGTSVTPRNGNRNYADVSSMTVLIDPTVNLTGATQLGNLVLGSKRNSGGDGSPQHEFILKRNETYVIIVTNQATAANETNIVCFWGEHINKN